MMRKCAICQVEMDESHMTVVPIGALRVWKCQSKGGCKKHQRDRWAHANEFRG